MKNRLPQLLFVFCMLLIAVVILHLLRCTEGPIAGNGSQTPNSGIIGKLYNPDGTPAANAKVYAIPSDHNPISNYNNRTSASIIDSTITNAKGEYTFDSLTKGYYNLLGYKENLSSFNDSVYIPGTSKETEAPPDTLKGPGSVHGVIKLQSGDNANTVFILIFGTYTWTVPSDSIGNFDVKNLAEGVYHVKFLTTLADYGPLDFDVTIRAEINDTLSDTLIMPFIGIPVPSGLKATYDTLNGLVNLAWNSLDYPRLNGYYVYRNDTSSNLPILISGNKALKDTFYTDTVFKNLLDTQNYVFVYRLKSQDTNAIMSKIYSSPFTIPAVSPTKVRTFINFKTVGTISDSGSIYDTIEIIVDYKNATRINTNIYWCINNPDSLIKEKNVSANSGSDTLEYYCSKIGIEKIYLKIKDKAGSLWKDSIEIQIVQDLPVAHAGNDTTVGKGDTIYLSGRKSMDKFGYIAKYEWDIGNTASFNEISNGDTLLIVDTFNFKGLYCILKVTDDDGGFDFDTTVITIGAVCLATDNASFSPRAGHTSVVHNGSIWLIAGKAISNNISNYINDVWYSADGKNWIQAIDSADFRPISGHTSVVFNNKIWLLGGYGSDKVWSSSDGINWTETASGTFISRGAHTSVVFDNKIWIIGGMVSTNITNDVWSSSDGVNWNEVTNAAAFSPRFGHASIVFNNKIWVIGGRDASGSFNDTWYSTDGISWIQATGAAAFIDRLDHTCIVFDNKIWIIGGQRYFADTATLNDIWYSSDGINWFEAINPAPFSPRKNHTTVVFDDKIWIIGGSRGLDMENDVWFLK